MSNEKTNRLQVVLETYGSDPQRWPAADRAALADLAELAGNEAGKAREIDLVLAGASKPSAPSGAEARLAQLVRETPQDTVETAAPSTYQPFGIGRFAAMSTLAASLVVGVYLGALGSLDPVLLGDGDFGVLTEVGEFEDPFDLDSLIGTGAEEAG